MWVIYAALLHVLLLGSIFVIYFRSPVITGLRPQKSYTNEQLEAPAKRLVLIVTDGLRAESFFRNGCADVKYLKKLMLQNGLVGISRTHVPTESRPGHIALIAGLYEDPSAVTRGWKENPIDFDTVFNRSAHTYAWGANDVLHIFAKLDDGGQQHKNLFDSYDHELDFSGKDKTYELDEWVFLHVKQFLNRRKAELLLQKQVVFFLHLLGLDSAGHIHKPGSKLFLENLHRTDKGIWNIVQLFNNVFPDDRTAFVLTADHGMTDAGSHGAGAPDETDTPFFLWGAGIPNKTVASTKTFALDKQQLPLYELEQAQFAALMSALLGIPPPMNNFGMLPRGFLNVTVAYEAHAVHSNALQLLEQFHKLYKQHSIGYFSKYLKVFEKLNTDDILAYKHITEEYLISNQFDLAINNSYKLMITALEGIDYYHSYYRNALLFSTVLTFIGWILYLLQVLINSQSKLNVSKRTNYFKYFIITLISIIFFIQHIPVGVSFYLILPVILWLFLLKPSKLQLLKSVHRFMSIGQIIQHVICAELLVLTFFERRFISLGFLVYAFLNNRKSFSIRNARFYIWLFLVLAVSIYPLLPPSVGQNNFALLALGVLCIAIRPFLVKSNLWHLAKFISIFALINTLVCIYFHMQQLSVPVFLQVLSWCFLVYTLIASWLYSTTSIKQCIELIFLNFTTLYAYFCTSYECLFVVMLSSELILNLSMHNSIDNKMSFDSILPKQKPSPRNMHQYFRLAFGILFYTLFSFFGSGNIASVSSFDPNIIRCFLSTFSPFLIMALVILKLIIPVLLNITIIFGLNPLVRSCEREVFICLLLICDVMGINFLFLVRNRGSWLEIGSSISHFVIMEVTTLVLLLLTYLAKVLLHFHLPLPLLKFK